MILDVNQAQCGHLLLWSSWATRAFCWRLQRHCHGSQVTRVVIWWIWLIWWWWWLLLLLKMRGF